VRAGSLVATNSPARLLIASCAVLVVCAALVPIINRLTTRPGRDGGGERGAARA
jgi:hypothetical protein